MVIWYTTMPFLLTKKFEETRRERASQARAHFEAHPPKGEFVVVLPPQRMRSHE